jgi:hypothetical protein
MPDIFFISSSWPQPWNSKSKLICSLAQILLFEKDSKHCSIYLSKPFPLIAWLLKMKLSQGSHPLIEQPSRNGSWMDEAASVCLHSLMPSMTYE